MLSSEEPALCVHWSSSCYWKMILDAVSDENSKTTIFHSERSKVQAKSSEVHSKRIEVHFKSTDVNFKSTEVYSKSTEVHFTSTEVQIGSPNTFFLQSSHSAFD